MTEQWSVPAWGALTVLAALVLLGLALAGAVRRARARTRAELASSRAETEALRHRVEELARGLERGAQAREPQEFVITGLGETGAVAPAARADGADGARGPADPVPMVEGRLFADLVLRETVVRAGSVAAGLRRVLAPETRHRIRFQMRREVKRSRKQRRVDTRAALREWQARQRAGTDAGDTA